MNLTPDQLEELSAAMHRLAEARRQEADALKEVRKLLPGFDAPQDMEPARRGPKPSAKPPELPTVVAIEQRPSSSHAVVAVLRDLGPTSLGELAREVKRRWPQLGMKSDTIRASVYRRDNWFSRDSNNVVALLSGAPTELPAPFGGAQP